MSETTVAAETAPVLHGEAILREIRASGVAYALMLPDVHTSNGLLDLFVAEQPTTVSAAATTSYSA